MQHPDGDNTASLFKLALAWLANWLVPLLSSITLQQVLLSVTIVLTLLEIIVLLRDKFIRRRVRK